MDSSHPKEHLTQEIAREGMVSFLTLSTPSDVVWARWRRNGQWGWDDTEDADWLLFYEGTQLLMFPAQSDDPQQPQDARLILPSEWIEGRRTAISTQKMDKHSYLAVFVESFVNHFSEVRIAYHLLVNLRTRRVSVKKTITKDRH